MSKPAHFVPLSIGEIVTALRAAKTKKERVELLKLHDCVALRSVLRMQYDPSLKFRLKPKDLDVKFSGLPSGLGECTLKGEARRFYTLLENRQKNIPERKVKQIFLNLLGGLDVVEAQILIDLADKKLSCGLTKKIVSEAFPDLLPKTKKKENDDDSTANGGTGEAGDETPAS